MYGTTSRPSRELLQAIALRKAADVRRIEATLEAAQAAGYSADAWVCEVALRSRHNDDLLAALHLARSYGF